MSERTHTLKDIIGDVQKEDKKDNKSDPINPDHYKIGGIEAIEYMKAKSTPEEFRGYLRLTALKYLSRAGHKDETVQEYKKAEWFINRLVKECDQ
jgi:hypothetical protein